MKTKLLELESANVKLTQSSEEHANSLKKVEQEKRDIELRYQAEIEELYCELDQETKNDAKMAADTFAATVKGAAAVKTAEDLKIKQGREIRELNTQNRAYIEELTQKQTEMQLILEKNEKLIASQSTKITVQDKYIKVDKIVP